jgi:hypothetical protein
MSPKDKMMYRETDEFQFREFLQQLVKAGYLDGKALGITALVIDKGREELSEKQEFVFQKEVLERYVHERCRVCQQKIPWCEMFFAIDRGECAACDPRLRPDRE